METKFHKILGKIEYRAERLGEALNNKTVKIITGTVFGITLVVFGVLIFLSKFFRSLFGIKD